MCVQNLGIRYNTRYNMSNTNEPMFGVVRGGSFYKLPVFEIKTGEGLTITEDKYDIRFVKGSKDDEQIYRQSGIRIADLLAMCAHHLESVNNDVPNGHTEEAIVKITDALNLLETRRKDRENRDVVDTYNK